LSPEELKDIPNVAGTLNEALDCLEVDHDFLLKGDVFTKDVIDMWISYKREVEVDAVRMRPCPEEFALYFYCYFACGCLSLYLLGCSLLFDKTPSRVIPGGGFLSEASACDRFANFFI